MKLIVGLGNPGPKYQNNRHNIGFMALDRMASDHGFLPWKAKFQGQICEGRLGAARAMFLKPETFMNNSGQSVQAAMQFYKIPLQDLIVFHDELDLAPAKLRYKLGGGHAGHNGLRSIHAHAGAEYARVRMGIGHPGHKDRVAGYVLSDFSKAEQNWLDDVLRGCSDGLCYLLENDPPKFLNAVAQRTVPARTSSGQKAPSHSAKPAKAPVETSVKDGDMRTPLQKLMERFK